MRISTHLVELFLMPEMEGKGGEREYIVHGLLTYWLNSMETYP